MQYTGNYEVQVYYKHTLNIHMKLARNVKFV